MSKSLRAKRFDLMRSVVFNGHPKKAIGSPSVLSNALSLSYITIDKGNTNICQKTINIFDKQHIRDNNASNAISNWTSDKGPCHGYTGDVIYYYSAWACANQKLMQGCFKENTQYTFSLRIFMEAYNELMLVYTDGTTERIHIFVDNDERLNTWTTVTFTSPAGKSIDYWRGYWNKEKNVYFAVDECMIYESSIKINGTTPKFEPFNKYKIPLKQSSENLFNYSQPTSDASTYADEDGYFTVDYDNSSGTSTKWFPCYTKPNLDLKPNTSYYVYIEVKEINGKDTLQTTVADIYNNEMQFTKSIYATSGYLTTVSDFSSCKYMLKTTVGVYAGKVGHVKFRVGVYESKQDKFIPYKRFNSNIYLNDELSENDKITVNLDRKKAIINNTDISDIQIWDEFSDLNGLNTKLTIDDIDSEPNITTHYYSKIK